MKIKISIALFNHAHLHQFSHTVRIPTYYAMSPYTRHTLHMYFYGNSLLLSRLIPNREIRLFWNHDRLLHPPQFCIMTNCLIKSNKPQTALASYTMKLGRIRTSVPITIVIRSSMRRPLINSSTRMKTERRRKQKPRWCTLICF